MKRMPSRALRWAVPQIVGALALIVMLGFAPAPGGALLLVPLDGSAGLARAAVDRGALIVDRGPGSTLVVRGDLGILDWPLLRHGVLTLGAPALLCGDTA